MGISRDTVRGALRRNQAPEYKRKEVINEEIAPFVDFIRESILERNTEDQGSWKIKSKG